MSTEHVETIRAALRTIKDPELDFNIVDLGLVYAIEARADGSIHITMTLTTPVCPLQDHFRQAIASAIQPIIGDAPWQVEFTFTPPWSLAIAEPAVQQHFALLGIPLSR
jgi:metal-sulfur cluster biosynthetic enzyme